MPKRKTVQGKTVKGKNGRKRANRTRRGLGPNDKFALLLTATQAIDPHAVTTDKVAVILNKKTKPPVLPSKPKRYVVVTPYSRTGPIDLSEKILPRHLEPVNNDLLATLETFKKTLKLNEHGTEDIPKMYVKNNPSDIPSKINNKAIDNITETYENVNKAYDKLDNIYDSYVNILNDRTNRSDNNDSKEKKEEQEKKEIKNKNDMKNNLDEISKLKLIQYVGIDDDISNLKKQIDDDKYTNQDNHLHHFDKFFPETFDDALEINNKQNEINNKQNDIDASHESIDKTEKLLFIMKVLNNKKIHYVTPGQIETVHNIIDKIIPYVKQELSEIYNTLFKKKKELNDIRKEQHKSRPQKLLNLLKNKDDNNNDKNKEKAKFDYIMMKKISKVVSANVKYILKLQDELIIKLKHSNTRWLKFENTLEFKTLLKYRKEKKVLTLTIKQLLELNNEIKILNLVEAEHYILNHIYENKDNRANKKVLKKAQSVTHKKNKYKSKSKNNQPLYKSVTHKKNTNVTSRVMPKVNNLLRKTRRTRRKPTPPPATNQKAR